MILENGYIFKTNGDSHHSTITYSLVLEKTSETLQDDFTWADQMSEVKNIMRENAQ